MKVAGFTVVTPNYLAHGRSVRDSFLRHHPDCDFYIGIIGSPENIPDQYTEDVYFITQIQDSRMEAMLKSYTAFEMSCAVKSYFASYFFEKFPSIDRLVFLDGDILVFNSMTFSTASITISPHRTRQTGFYPFSNSLSDVSLNRFGVYNAGYFEVMRDDEGLRFLNWWKDLMSTMCYDRPDEHLFTDQLWLNAVPAFFENVQIIKNPGYNVAYWNLIERTVKEKEGQFFVEDQPLVFYHYSSYNIEKPDAMTAFVEDYLSFENFPQLRSLYKEYETSVRKHGYDKYKSLVYPFAQEKKKSVGFLKKIFK
jgi:hypothetical protein